MRKEDAFQQAEFIRKVRMPVFPDFDCWVISVEDLILAKLIWIQQLFSQQQIDDVKNMIHDCPNLDRMYVSTWIKQLKLNDFGLTI